MIDLDGQGHEPLPTLKPIETGSTSHTRRERRVAARRAQILEAAEAVFAAKGYHGATTREIAQAADVSEGTLYNYFANKRDLFIGLMSRRTDELVESIAEVQADSVEGAMVQLLAGQLTRMRENHQFRLFLQEARLDPELNRTLVELMLPRISQQVERLMTDLIDARVMRRVRPRNRQLDVDERRRRAGPVQRPGRRAGTRIDLG